MQSDATFLVSYCSFTDKFCSKSYREVMSDARMLAKQLFLYLKDDTSQVKDGLRVGLFMRNSYESVVTLFALWLFPNIIVYLIPYDAKDNEILSLPFRLHYLLGSNLIFRKCHTARLEISYKYGYFFCHAFDEEIRGANSDALNEWYEIFENRCPYELEDFVVTPERIALYLLTSGSTGKPKGNRLLRYLDTFFNCVSCSGCA
jgi:acyl-CoA synthetase (AMP-forming)/AMP-acid ligase II